MAILNDEQVMLRDAARDWTQEKSPVAALRKLRDAPGAPPPVFGPACVAPACKEWMQPAF